MCEASDRRLLAVYKSVIKQLEQLAKEFGGPKGLPASEIVLRFQRCSLCGMEDVRFAAMPCCRGRWGRFKPLECLIELVLEEFAHFSRLVVKRAEFIPSRRPPKSPFCKADVGMWLTFKADKLAKMLCVTPIMGKDVYSITIQVVKHTFLSCDSWRYFGVDTDIVPVSVNRDNPDLPLPASGSDSHPRAAGLDWFSLDGSELPSAPAHVPLPNGMDTVDDLAACLEEILGDEVGISGEDLIAGCDDYPSDVQDSSEDDTHDVPAAIPAAPALIQTFEDALSELGVLEQSPWRFSTPNPDGTALPLGRFHVIGRDVPVVKATCERHDSCFAWLWITGAWPLDAVQLELVRWLSKAKSLDAAAHKRLSDDVARKQGRNPKS